MGILFTSFIPRLERPTLAAGILPGLITLFYYLLFRFSKLPLFTLRLPFKEMMIATCFVIGISIAATTEPPGVFHSLLMGGLVFLFSGNCLLIARAERDLDRLNDRAAHYASGRHKGNARLPEIMLILALIFGIFVLAAGHFPLTALASLVCTVSTLLLACFSQGRDSDSTQAKADGILVLPLLMAVTKLMMAE